MPNCGNGLRSKLGNSGVDCNEDILCGATDGLRGRFRANAVTERTVREPH